MRLTLKYGMLFMIILFLWLPILQYSTQFFYFKPLNGSFTKKENTAFTLTTWLSGDFQSKKEEFKNENFGFRNFLVRLNHQMYFLLFKYAKANGATVGKDNYLFEKAYIDAYYGNDFIGYKKIRAYLGKLKQAQDSLQKQGKLFILVFASGKASYYPEYIPDELKSSAKPSNHLVFSAMAKKLGVNLIDFNTYFVQQKHKSPYPLYPQYGIHWSNYGSVIAFDSIVSYIENKLQVDLPDLIINSVEVPDTLRESDNDLIKGMNLLWQPKTFKMAYPVFSFNYDSLKHKKINSLVVSDSYWWQIYGAGLQQNTFNAYSFWYYNKEIHPEFFRFPNLYVERSNYFKRLRSSDVIILMHTEATLPVFGNGFTDLCYETFCQKPDTAKEKIAEIKELIVTSTDWFKGIEEKAKKQNLPVDSMLTMDAEWVYKEKF